MSPKLLGATVMKIVRNTAAMLLVLMVAGACGKNAGQSTVRHAAESPKKQVPLPLLLMTTANEQELFQSDKPIATGQKIQVSGVVQYWTTGFGLDPGLAPYTVPYNASDRDSTAVYYATLELDKGHFKVVLDEKGREMVSKEQGHTVTVLGLLTGNADVRHPQRLNITPVNNIYSESGTITATEDRNITIRSPELIVQEYH